MDEILASIRKIIENNEAQPDLAADADEGEDFGIVAESRPGLLDHPAVVERFHAEEQRAASVQPFQRAEPVRSVQPAQPSQPALSLADVAARVRAASERHVAANRENAEPAQAVENPLETIRMSDTSAENREAAMDEQEAVEPAEAIAEPGRDIAALVSPAVGERVAQSFGALAEAIDAGPRRSFDEIAEDMLRPMLQEWLDDNLPTLVERLVREEIERVARGPRR